MKSIISALFIFAVFGVSASASASSSQHEQLVRETVKLSGNEGLLEQVAGVFTGGQSVEQGTSEDRKIGELLAKNFDVEKGRKMLYESVSKNCDDATLKALIRWYQSPLGKKITEEEIKAEKATIKAKRSYLEGLGDAPPSRDRVDLMVRFVDQSQIPEKMHQILIKATTAFAVALTDNGKNGDLDRVTEYLASGPVDVNELRKSEVLMSFYTYRDISNSEIEKYVAFMGTPEYRVFQDQVLASVGATLVTAFSNTGAEMAKRLRTVADTGDTMAIADAPSPQGADAR